MRRGIAVVLVLVACEPSHAGEITYGPVTPAGGAPLSKAPPPGQEATEPAPEPAPVHHQQTEQERLRELSEAARKGLNTRQPDPPPSRRECLNASNCYTGEVCAKESVLSMRGYCTLAN